MGKGSASNRDQSSKKANQGQSTKLANSDQKTEKSEPRLPLWVQVGLILLLTLIVTMTTVYMHSKLCGMRTELEVMKEEINKLGGELLAEAQEEDITVELGLSFKSDPFRDFLPARSSRLKRALPENNENNERQKKREKRKKGSRRRRTSQRKDSRYVMHFTLDQEAVNKEMNSGCMAPSMNNSIYSDLSLLCGVVQFPLWQNRMENSTPAGHLTRDRSKLRITRNGTYHVYAQFTFHDDLLNPVFRIRKQPSADEDSTILSECSGLEPFPIDLHPQNRTYMAFNQCHSERAVRLTEGNHIFVENVRPSSIIRTSHHLTFWGLFWVSD